MTSVSDSDYRNLFVFRYALRQFLRWSDQQAAQIGLTPQQCQVLLAIRAHQRDCGPSIGEVAEYMLVRHHSAVEIVRRLERMGLVARNSDEHDQRVVRLHVTAEGDQLLQRLTSAQLSELEQAAQTLRIDQEFLLRLSHDFIGGDTQHP